MQKLSYLLTGSGLRSCGATLNPAVLEVGSRGIYQILAWVLIIDWKKLFSLDKKKNMLKGASAYLYPSHIGLTLGLN